jgi:hypothetical protein
MLVNFEQDERARHFFDSKSALVAGLSVGVLFLVFAKANPWGSLGVPTHVMGRQIFPNNTPVDFIWTGIIQLVVSVVYGFVISGIVYRMKTVPAFFAGAGTGLVLAGLNYLLFRFLFTGVPGTSETVVAFTHMAFGMITAGAYKGFSIPQPRPEVMQP